MSVPAVSGHLQPGRMTTKDMFAAFEGLRAVKVCPRLQSCHWWFEDAIVALARHLENAALMRVRPELGRIVGAW